MTTVVYPALVGGDRAGGYTARFPDLAECAASGGTPSELLAQAREAARAHLSALAAAGEDWPEPTPIERLAAPGGVILVDVPADDAPVRVNISIGERLLKRIDTAAEARGMTRSGFIAAAARTALGEGGAKPGAAADFEAAAGRLQEELAQVGRRISESLGPDSAFSRTMSDLDVRVSEGIRKAADSISSAMARRRDPETRAADSEPESAPPPGATKP